MGDRKMLEGNVFPERKELKNIRLLFFPKGYLGIELIMYGMMLLTLLFFGIYGGMMSFLGGIIFIAVGFVIQLNIMNENPVKR